MGAGTVEIGGEPHSGRFQPVGDGVATTLRWPAPWPCSSRGSSSRRWKVSQAGEPPLPWFHQSLYQPYSPPSGMTTRVSRSWGVVATSVSRVQLSYVSQQP